MKLLSINIATPVSLSVKGKTVQTSIFKTPVAGPVALGLMDLVGNTQADLVNHGGADKAVYAFGANHYIYWQQWLNKAKSLNYGALGENLTLSELDENSLCIGDELSIGNTVLAVTQFRVPCFKLGLKFERLDMPAAFIQYAHTGAYFKVLQTGTIESNSEVSISHRNSEQVALKPLFEAWFKPKTHGNTALIERALKIDNLSAQWRERFSARLSRL